MAMTSDESVYFEARSDGLVGLHIEAVGFGVLEMGFVTDEAERLQIELTAALSEANDGDE